MFCFYIPNPSIQTISKHVVIVWNRKLVKLKPYCCKSWIGDNSLIALNKIKYSTCLLIAFNLSTPSNPSSTLLIMLFQNLPKPPSQHFSREHLRHVNIFFHVLVYSCQPIVVPQAVVRGPELGANQPSCPKSGPTDLTVQTIGSAPSKQ